jgi:hypothetical protein
MTVIIFFDISTVVEYTFVFTLTCHSVLTNFAAKSNYQGKHMGDCTLRIDTGSLFHSCDISIPPTQYFVVFFDDMLSTTKCNMASPKMLSCLTRNPGPIHTTHCMIQILPILFKTPSNRIPIMRDTTETRTDPFHGLRVKWQKVVPPLMLYLSGTIWYTAGKWKMRSDLARMDRALENRGSNEDRRNTVCIVAWGSFGVQCDIRKYRV